MGVREQMVGILRSNEARRINFTFTGTSGFDVTVNSSTFARVATALANGDLGVVEGHFDSEIAMYSAHRENGQSANTFYLGTTPRWSRRFNALIVHESVHASFDLTRTTIPWIDNEAAGCIAQGYYLRNSGYPRHQLEFGSQASIGYLMVNEIVSGGDPDYFLEQLRNSLLSSETYQSYISGTFRGDG